MRQPKSAHKKHKLRLSPNKFQVIASILKSHNSLEGICIFIKFTTLLYATEKRYIPLNKKIYSLLLFKLIWQNYYNILFNIYQHFFTRIKNNSSNTKNCAPKGAQFYLCKFSIPSLISCILLSISAMLSAHRLSSATIFSEPSISFLYFILCSRLAQKSIAMVRS